MVGYFCGTPLWDSNLTWYTDTPQLTSCFKSTVLTYVPVFILLIFLPLETRIYLNSTTRGIPWRLGILTRTFLTGAIILLSLIQIWIFYTDNDEVIFLADRIMPWVKLVGFSVSLTLTFLSKHYGQVTSPTQFFFWLTVSICQSLSVLSSVISRTEEENLPGLTVISSLYLGVGLVIFILNLFPDSPPHYRDLTTVTENPSPEENSSFASIIFFRWFDSFILSGWRKPIDQKNLWDLSYEDSCIAIIPKWEKHLYSSGRENISIILPLVKCFGLFFLQGSLCQFVYVGLQFVNPQILTLVIDFVEERAEMWKGYMYVVLLAVNSLLIGMFECWYWNTLRILAMRSVTAITSSIYKKSLVLSSEGRSQLTAGQIVNLIAVDCNKVQNSLGYLNFMLTVPLQIILTIYFLWEYLNYSVLIGVSILMLTLPVNIYIWSIMKKYQKKQMKLKDIRVNLVSEILNGIKVLKLYAWEESFIEKISKLRREEIESLKIFQYLEGTQLMMWTCAPIIVAISSFTSFVLIDPVNNVLDAKTAFVSLTLFNTLKKPLFMLPLGIVNVIQGIVSVQRINNFLNANEIDPNNVTHDEMECPIIMRHANLAWKNDEYFPNLRNISLSVKEGSLVAIIGKVGSGKSSLLAALLGEMRRISGIINTNGSIAYVPQQAWMRNMSLKKNILFGKKYSCKLYDRVIQCCALVDDLKMLPDGDATEIGEKGINLSGGQKQRINLARAVYSNRDIYLMDDPLSAVDAHVGKHLFDKVIGPRGILNKKTRVLVTHAIKFLPKTDLILVVKDGAISEMGTYRQLMSKKGEFANFVLEQKEFSDEHGNKEEISENKSYSDVKKTMDNDSIKKMSRTMSTYSQSDQSTHSTNSNENKTSSEGSTRKPLIEDEFVEVNNVKLDVYLYYLRSAGVKLGLLSLVGYCISQGCNVLANIWLTLWSDDPAASEDISIRNKYLIGYGLIGLSQSIFLLVGIVLVTLATIQASVKLHDKLLYRILHSMMVFFDTTPIGRIINRFSHDIDEVDIELPLNFKDVINQFLNVVGIIFMLSFVTPLSLLAILPLIVIFVFVQRFYLQTSRQLKRLYSVNRSPINSHFDETLAGVSIIRAYGFQEQFIDENESKIENLQKSKHPEILTNSWLLIRLQLIVNLLLIVTTLITVMNRDSTEPGLVGLSLTYILNCQNEIYYLVRFSAELEKSIVSVERIREYQDTPQEAASKTDFDPDKSWPEQGNILFEEYSTRYRPELDLVLSNININIHSGEKIGIVGRTGAGKSSVTVSLFRMIEAASGSICIDNINIAQIGLSSLRSGLTIIPQDPVVFSGTLRFNVDPFDRHTDRDIWKALEMANLATVVRKLQGGLDHQISEGGVNFSVGQRQLLCLVRALLRRTKVIILDEATAAVDIETDEFIQETIRNEFRECTVLTIAHRLNTVMDSSRVMVMDRGKVVEFDTPSNLLQDPESSFRSMAADAGLVSSSPQIEVS